MTARLEPARGFRSAPTGKNQRMTITRKITIAIAILFTAWLLFGRAGGSEDYDRCLRDAKRFDQQHGGTVQPTAFERCNPGRSPG